MIAENVGTELADAGAAKAAAAKTAPAAAKAAVAAKTAPAAAKAAVAAKVTPAVKTAGVLSTAKAGLLSPLFGIALLCGIIGWELWTGRKDAGELEAAKEAKT